MSIEAMKQALEALNTGNNEVLPEDYGQMVSEAITALRAAIEQAETPEKRRAKVDPIRVRIMQEAYDLADRDDPEGYNSVKVMCSDVLAMINKLLDERQPEQEPVAWMYVNTDGECEQIEFSKNWPVPDDPSVTRLYAAPREWQGLTDEERKSIREWQRIQEELGPVWAPMMLYLYEAIEAKLKEKNG